MNIGYCPKTSRDANGYNRNYRFKVLLNVAKATAFTLYSAKTQRRDLKNAYLVMNSNLSSSFWREVFCMNSTSEKRRWKQMDDSSQSESQKGLCCKNYVLEDFYYCLFVSRK